MTTTLEGRGERKVRGLLLAAAAAVALGAGGARAGEGPAVGVGGSTLGLGAWLGFAVGEQVGLRVAANGFDYDYDGTEAGIPYSLTLKLRSAGAFLDWHPGGRGFRVTVGILGNGNEITAKAEAQTSYVIGGTTYTAADVGTLTAQVDFRRAAPYLGIGWGGAIGGDGLGLYADLGVMFQGSPRARLSVTGSGVSAADLAQEQAEFQAAIDDYEYHLVLGLGVFHRF